MQLEPQKERKENAVEVANYRTEDLPKQMTGIPPQTQKKSGKTKMGVNRKKIALRNIRDKWLKKKCNNNKKACKAYIEKKIYLQIKN